jgi:transposase
MLAQVLLPNPRLLHPLGVVVAPEELTLVAVTVSPTAACPVCGAVSTRAHSNYLRTFADLPCVQTPVRLHLHTRRFFCEASDCPRRIFTERLPEVAGPYARRTLRLAEALQQIAHALGGEAGARMSARLGMAVSADTLLRQLAARAISESETPRVLGVDDWALRKGQRYGTILVDLERGRVIELLPDRQAETLAQWLQEHPGVEIITRDRAGAYAAGARLGAPDAQQVADRWHLLKNLVEALEGAVAREERALQQAAAGAKEAPEPPPPVVRATELPPDAEEPAPPPPTTRAERERQHRRERKRTLFEEVRRLHRAGHSILGIARQTGKDPRTIRKYVAADAFPEPKQRRRVGGLAGFHGYLERRWREGCHNAAQLWRELGAQGYPGSRSAVRQWVAGWRAPLSPGGRQTKARPPRAQAPAPRSVAWWLVSPREKLTEEQAAFLERLKQQSPRVELAQRLSQEFFALTRQREAEKLAGWLECVRGSGIEELKGFGAGLRRDWEAVSAGLTLKWSNGPVEGQINRLKGLKRQMFGRAGLPLLRARVLPLAAPV